MASPWWDEALERLKAIQATHVEEKCAPMAVWVRLSFVLPIYSVTLIIGRPLMQNTFPLCQQRPEQHDRACGYAHGDRRCWSQWTVLTENDRYVRDLSKKTRTFIYICSQRVWRLLPNWPFKSCQVLGSSELPWNTVAHTPFQHQTIASSESMA